MKKKNKIPDDNASSSSDHHQEIPMENEITIDTLKGIEDDVRKRTEGKFLRVPPKLYKANQEAYTPVFISLGPFHSIGLNMADIKDANILAMESKKRIYMLKLLTSTPSSETTLVSCCKFINDNSENIRKFYDKDVTEVLKTTMLVDGCFLLQYLFLLDTKTLPQEDDVLLKRDVVLLENQIPFFVLKGLYQFVEKDIEHYYTMNNIPKPNLKTKILKGYRLTPMSLQQEQQLEQETKNDSFEPTHLLDVIRKYNRPLKTRSDGLTFFLIKSAKKLTLSGVTICSSSGSNLLDLRFSKGVLYIPPLIIDDYTETLLINLVAYEHVSPNIEPYFTSYVFFMSQLIERKHDFKLLEKKGIIQSRLGSRTEAKKLFSNISKQLVLKKFCYSALCSDITSYVNTSWRIHQQVLKLTYLDSPWKVISVFAGTVLLVLTLLQTIYTMKSYYQPQPKPLGS